MGSQTLQNDKNQRYQKAGRGDEKEQKHPRIPMVSDKQIAANGSWLRTKLRIQHSRPQQQLLQKKGREPQKHACCASHLKNPEAPFTHNHVVNDGGGLQTLESANRCRPPPFAPLKSSALVSSFGRWSNRHVEEAAAKNDKNGGQL
jgi:hypothetical protein